MVVGVSTGTKHQREKKGRETLEIEERGKVLGEEMNESYTTTSHSAVVGKQQS